MENLTGAMTSWYSCLTADANKSNDLTNMSPGLSTEMETASDNEQKGASTNGESGLEGDDV